MLETIDNALNRLTMYWVVAGGVGLVLLAAAVLGAAGVIAISPLGLAASVVVLTVAAYATNQLGAAWRHVPAGGLSWLITALILAAILPPVTSVQTALLAAATAALAIASKYVLVWRGSNVFNPAATGALIMSVTGLWPATWWLASPSLIAFTGLEAIVVLRKTRRFQLFGVFILSILAVMLLVQSVLHGQPAGLVLKSAFLSWPIVFFGSIMLTEPATLPSGRFYQWLYAGLVAVLCGSQLHIGNLATTPQLALVIGNVFAWAVASKPGLLVRLASRRELVPGITELTFALPAGARLSFEPGQYADWTLAGVPRSFRGNRRTFSLASAPGDDKLRIAFRHDAPVSAFKAKMLTLKPGALVRVAQAGGSFVLPADPRRPLLLVAGGIGITPFVSMIRHLLASGERRDITLVYAGRSEREFAYRKLLAEAMAVGVTVRYIVGSVTAEALALNGNPTAAADPEVYVSGPPAMVEATSRLLRARGVARRRLHTDLFTGY